MNGDYFSNPMFPTEINDFDDSNIPQKETSDFKNVINRRVTIYTDEAEFEGIIKDYSDDYITVFEEKTNTWLLFFKSHIKYIKVVDN